MSFRPGKHLKIIPRITISNLRKRKKKTMEANESGPTIISNNLPFAIICDIDGTIADLNGRSPFDTTKYLSDKTIEPISNILRQLRDYYVLILITGRKEEYREVTEKWLVENDIPFDHLFMRKDDDKRQDTAIKKEIYFTFIDGEFHIEFVLEDRKRVVDMWRSIGLTCLQVTDGNY